MTSEVPGRCKSVAPIMPTTDIARTKTHYERMGFVVETYGEFVMTRRDDIELFFSLNADHDPKKTASCIYVRVNDADALHAHWQTAGVTGLNELRNTDYGMREFFYYDPDNNLINFGSPLKS